MKGNDVPADASAEARKAEYVETAKERSDRELKKAKEIDYDVMSDADFENYNEFFLRYRAKRKPLKPGRIAA
jgi:hypothetical protein